MGILPPMCCYIQVYWLQWRMNKERILFANENLLHFLKPRWHPEIIVDLTSLDNYSVLYQYPETWKKHLQKSGSGPERLH